MYGKFGFCKLQQKCKRKHYSEICQENEACKTITACHKKILGDARKILQEMSVILEMIVRTNMKQDKLQIKLLK